MSTNSECVIVEETPGRWFYVLEDYGAPKNAWDWREFATAYGPFTTLDVAEEHLRGNHANPGGYSTYAAGEYRLDPLIKRLISEARL